MCIPFNTVISVLAVYLLEKFTQVREDIGLRLLTAPFYTIARKRKERANLNIH